MVQETYDTHPAIRDACDTYIGAHAAEVAKDIAAAKALYAPQAQWSAESLALSTQAVLQGALVLAKAKGGPDVARDCLAHLRRYLVQLFHRPPAKRSNSNGCTTREVHLVRRDDERHESSDGILQRRDRLAPPSPW
jgi:TetR/AcrR family transcriptional repressor of nem operon